MQSDSQDNDNPQLPPLDSQISSTNPTSIPSDRESGPPITPFRLPIRPTERSRTKLIISIVIGVVVFGVAGAGITYALMQNIPKQTSGNEVQKSDAVTIPEGWKKFTSKKFGMSFIVPEKWSVNEFDPQTLNTGANGVFGYRITVSDPDDHSGGIMFDVSREKLNESVNKAKESESNANKLTTKSLKWRGYDAVEVSYELKDSEDKLITLRILYVQIGDYVFTIPGSNDTPRGVIDGVVTEEVYKQFANSIRVDFRVVQTQAKEDAKPVILPQGKDVNLGAVTTPGGWKKVQSTKYGISFVIPNNWATNEQTNPTGGAVLGLSVGSSPSYEGEVTIMVTTNTLDNDSNQAAYFTGAFSGGSVSTKTEKLKWNGYEARRVTVSSNTSSTQSSILLVRVGNYTYHIPDPYSDQSGVVTGKFDSTQYKTFVESIRIKEN
jgi:hypothetical protein